MTAYNLASLRRAGAEFLQAKKHESSPADCLKIFCPQSKLSPPVCPDKRQIHEAALTRLDAGGACWGGWREGLNSQAAIGAA